MTSRIAGAALVAALVACDASPRDIASRPAAPTAVGTGQFEDPEGRPITISQLPVRRIVSTMQTATEWLVLLDVADRIVARTDFDRQPQLAALPSIGGGLDPSPEAIAALTPDVIIGWRSGGSVRLQRALEPFDIPVISLETTDTADLLRNLALLGTLVGREQRADSLARVLRGELAAARASCDHGKPPASAMLVLWSDPPMTAGSGTWMHELLGLACLRNAFGDLVAPWPTISMEAISARQPEWIITSTGDRAGQRLAEFRGRSGWRDLDAVRAGRIIEVPGDLFARAGPTLAEAVREIVRGVRRGPVSSRP